jgi:glycosyltransferase involved in cell wall biosynthesis
MPTDERSCAPELIVLSHLRWLWVWQRPQHLVSRLAQDRRTWFVEEPWPADVDEPRLRTEQHGAITRVWLDVPAEGFLYFDDPTAAPYEHLLPELLGEGNGRVVWLYTALALDLARALDPALVVFDVMDDLASFAAASRQHRLQHHRALREADLVFTGGRSLHAGVTSVRTADVQLFPSGVEPEHYAPARAARPASRPRPVAGYVGVVDERLDLDLVAGLAAALPDWDVEMVGPTTKVADEDLPQADNIRWLGGRPYEALPSMMAGFDVALMPFARNEATRSISPTKTLEYLAAGLPVVSTRIADVVADYGNVVALADDVEGFAAHCRRLLGERSVARPDVETVLHRQHWDTIARAMDALMNRHLSTLEEAEASA